MLSSSFVPSTCQSVLKIEGAMFCRSHFSSSVSSIKIVSMEIRDQRSTDASTSHGGTANSGFWVKLDSAESGNDLELLHTRSRNNGVVRWSERPEGQKLSSLSMT